MNTVARSQSKSQRRFQGEAHGNRRRAGQKIVACVVETDCTRAVLAFTTSSKLLKIRRLRERDGQNLSSARARGQSEPPAVNSSNTMASRTSGLRHTYSVPTLRLGTHCQRGSVSQEDTQSGVLFRFASLFIGRSPIFLSRRISKQQLRKRLLNLRRPIAVGHHDRHLVIGLPSRAVDDERLALMLHRAASLPIGAHGGGSRAARARGRFSARSCESAISSNSSSMTSLGTHWVFFVLAVGTCDFHQPSDSAGGPGHGFAR